MNARAARMPRARTPLSRAGVLGAVLAAALGGALALAGCAAPAAGTTAPAASAATGSSLPGGHVHGIAATGDGSTVLIGTHQGVYDVSGAEPERISAADDFMGFVGDPAGTLWASGHPGPGSSRPNPLGLLRSTDGGRTWTAVSNEGVSDFHALTVTTSGLVGFDGVLKRTPTGEAWAAVASSLHPAVLAGHPSADTVLATTEKGLFASLDGGTTWLAVPGAPLIQFAAFADARRVVGVAPDGAVYSSADAGVSWTRLGDAGKGVEAVTAVAAPGQAVRVLVATDSGLLESRDGGATFAAYEPGRP
ncbi:F510_1955 family glycosylhydrolase [Sinomonas flava]|uniref:F510_1955 family glycosylhydrolase n=1 Tax=Sinomonas flava TaxID=496857 RepID=UPI0039A4FDDB